MGIGDKVDRLRIQRHLTQKALAEKLLKAGFQLIGIRGKGPITPKKIHAWIGNLVTGRQKTVTDLQLSTLAKVLQVQEKDLIGSEVPGLSHGADDEHVMRFSDCRAVTINQGSVSLDFVQPGAKDRMTIVGVILKNVVPTATDNPTNPPATVEEATNRRVHTIAVRSRPKSGKPV